MKQPSLKRYYMYLRRDVTFLYQINFKQVLLWSSLEQSVKCQSFVLLNYYYYFFVLFHAFLVSRGNLGTQSYTPFPLRNICSPLFAIFIEKKLSSETQRRDLLFFSSEEMILVLVSIYLDGQICLSARFCIILDLNNTITVE